MISVALLDRVDASPLSPAEGTNDIQGQDLALKQARVESILLWLLRAPDQRDETGARPIT